MFVASPIFCFLTQRGAFEIMHRGTRGRERASPPLRWDRLTDFALYLSDLDSVWSRLSRTNWLNNDLATFYAVKNSFVTLILQEIEQKEKVDIFNIIDQNYSRIREISKTLKIFEIRFEIRKWELKNAKWGPVSASPPALG